MIYIVIQSAGENTKIQNGIYANEIQNWIGLEMRGLAVDFFSVHKANGTTNVISLEIAYGFNFHSENNFHI